MDCLMISSRVAAFVDGELESCECERFVLHIETCDPCTQIVIQIEAQRFSPLSADQRRSICERGAFWGEMDTELNGHLDALVVAPVGPWHRRRGGLPVPMVVAYAAAILLAVVWGVQQQERAQLAELASEHLGQQLEKERRLAAQPGVITPPVSGDGSYKVVTYAPERASF